MKARPSKPLKIILAEESQFQPLPPSNDFPPLKPIFQQAEGLSRLSTIPLPPLSGKGLPCLTLLINQILREKLFNCKHVITFVENQKFYLKISGAILSILIASSVLVLNYSMKGFTAATLTAGSAFLIKNAEKTSRKTGRTEKMKAVLKASKEGSELLIISAGLISYLTGTAATATIIGLVAFSKIVKTDISSVEEFFGQEIRVGILIIAFLGLQFNQYVLFYGLVAVGLVSAFDTVHMLYRSFKNSF